MNLETIEINILFYKEIAQCDDRYENTLQFDKECGLEYFSRPDGYDLESFFFKIIDKQKYFLAKIKYNI